MDLETIKNVTRPNPISSYIGAIFFEETRL